MLNFNTGGGSFTPYINYMASIQGWEMSGEDGKQNFDVQASRVRSQSNPNWLAKVA